MTPTISTACAVRAFRRVIRDQIESERTSAEDPITIEYGLGGMDAFYSRRASKARLERAGARLGLDAQAFAVFMAHHEALEAPWALVDLDDLDVMRVASSAAEELSFAHQAWEALAQFENREWEAQERGARARQVRLNRLADRRARKFARIRAQVERTEAHYAAQVRAALGAP